MKIPEPKGGGDFEPTPEGQYTAICTRIVDLGTQRTEGAYGVKHVRKVMIGWELPEARVKDADGKDMPALHQERYTWSMHEKASLRKLLESWRGVKFKESDFGTFDTKNLIGVPCLMQIAHDVGANGKTYANIQSIMRCPLPREKWPKPEGAPIYLSLDEFSQSEYDKLSEYWQDLIAESPEYSGTAGHSIGQAESDKNNFGMDDDIPF